MVVTHLEIMEERLAALLKKIEKQLTNLDLAKQKKNLNALKKEQETFAATQNFKELKRITMAIKHLENTVTPWQKLQANALELKSLFQVFRTDETDEWLTEFTHNLTELENNCHQLHLETLFRAEDDKRNVYLSLHAGAGGTEACDWAGMLMRMYIRFAERKKFSVKIIDSLAESTAGIKSATLYIKGKHACGNLRCERGVHRLVRLSPFDANKRRHTSFASVAILPEVDEELPVKILTGDVRIDTFRASGAGGQHVNTTDSAVRLTHVPSGIVVSCQVERSQYQNKEQAFKVLRARLYERERSAKLKTTQELQKTQKKIEWGSQIRSYILHPYQLIKDHRTNCEVGDVKAVLDGELDKFIAAYLQQEVLS